MSVKRTYWVAGYALATQTSFPHERLEDKLYGEVLRVLDGDADWEQLPVGSALKTVNALSAQTGEKQVGSMLAEALAGRPTEADVCVIDLRPAVMTGEIKPVFPRSYAVVAEKLRELLDGGNVGESHVLVVVPKLGKREEFQLKHFSHLSEAGPLTILDQLGEVWSKRFEGVNREKLAALFEQGIAEPKEALERKMIRRRGVFPRFNLEGETDGHTKNFFDARYCGEELRALLADELRTALDGARPLSVVYNEAPSNWLEPALLHAITELTEQDADLKDDLELVSYQELDDSKGEAVRDVLAVLPVVDRGDSLRALIEAVKKWAPAAKVNAVSVVCTRDTGGKRADFGGTSLSSLMTAQQEPAGPMVAPDSSYYETGIDGAERFLPFTSLEFWEMASEAGFIEELEEEVPDNRSRLRRVPDLLEFMHQNAAWVASKIETAVEHFTGRDITEVSVALVQNETAASKLSDVLAETVGNAPLGVPREALNEWRAKKGNKKALFKKWREEGADWLLAVEAAPATRLVIIDEFSYSGRTLEDMASLLTAANFEVLLALTIANFSRSSLERAVQDHKTFAFYETEWRRPETQKLIEVG